MPYERCSLFLNFLCKNLIFLLSLSFHNSLALCGALEHFGFHAPILTEFGSHKIWNNPTAFENWFIDQCGGFLSIVGHGLTGNRLLQPIYSDTSDKEDDIELQTFSRSSPDRTEDQIEKPPIHKPILSFALPIYKFSSWLLVK